MIKLCNFAFYLICSQEIELCCVICRCAKRNNETDIQKHWQWHKRRDGVKLLWNTCT